MHRIVLFIMFPSILAASFARADIANDPNVPLTTLVPGKIWIVPDIAMKCVYVESGTFQMGSADSGPNDEKPVHKVRLSHGFWMGACEVTQAQWRALMKTDPSKYKGDELPIEMISWYEAVEFCRKLTDRERKAGRLPEGHVYRLPTEAEWEYAARGGMRSRGFEYPGSDDPNEVAWHWPGSSDKTHAVGTKRPNELGLYDMAGNVWEWCLDWYAPDYYGRSPNVNPINRDYGDKKYRICRGGSWGLYPTHCRSANRGGGTPTGRFYSYGFRVVLARSID